MKKLIIYFGILCLVANLSAMEYQVDKTKDNMVLFVSQAPVESFDGSTNSIDGYVLWKGDNPLNQCEFYFEVDLSTFDTGIGMRNQHMRDNYLETDKFRYAIFTGTLTSIDTLDIENTYDVVVDGMLNLHGVEQPYTMDGRVSLDADTMNVQCGFEVMLEQHKIKVPKIMFVKISPIIQLDINFYLRKVEEEGE